MEEKSRCIWLIGEGKKEAELLQDIGSSENAEKPLL